MDNMSKSIYLAALIFLNAVNSIAQQDQTHHTEPDANVVCSDSTSLADYFRKANLEAHMRTFAMSTLNEGSLKDDYALASGAGLGILTKPFKGFQMGISGFFIYNVYSSSLAKKDPITGQSNRYELGLFDMESHTNKYDLDRLEELYLKYSHKRGAISIGKLNINTPYINPQDGRMRPTIEEGVWCNFKLTEKLAFNSGWIWRISPRSTVKWYDLAKSMGVYPSGVNIDGSKSDYSNNVNSEGLGIANIVYTPIKNWKINVWNFWVENIINTALIEVSATHPLTTHFSWYHGLQYFHQSALHNGGNKDQQKTYITKGAQSNVISTQIGIKSKKSNYSFSYTHITGDGRFLMPREWGRESFYTFMQRERNEGLGNVHAFVVKYAVQNECGRLKNSVAFGHFILPDVKNFRLNKYGMPSYHQLNYDVAYGFPKFLKGMEIRFLAALKVKAGEIYKDYKYVYNKVNMVNLNLVLDFKI
jgi:outer membrane porin, OprD family